MKARSSAGVKDSRRSSSRPKAAPKASKTPAPPKKWTAMVWIAGDNNLEANGVQDIREMKRVGSTADLNIVAQFDSMSDDHARRYFLRKGTSVAADMVADLGPTNTGDPKVAIAFFKWAMSKYPADRYLAVIWNHGSGIDETDVYRGRAGRTASGKVKVAKRKAPRPKAAVPQGRVALALNNGYRKALFAPTLDSAFRSRAIAYDDTARDFLDNMELREVFEKVRESLGRKIDVVGFDACLMNVAEIAYELKDAAEFIVGSEEVEPVDGWPYDRVLGKLAKDPSMDARTLAKVAVNEYIKSYTSDSVTQSALDLGQADNMRKAVDVLAGALIADILDPREYGAVSKALNGAQHFDMADFIDLHDLAEQLKQHSTSAQLKAAATAVQDALTGPSPFVAAEAHKGAKVGRSRGVAIYYPRGTVTLTYDRLAFAKDTRWDEFIVAFTGQPIPSPPPGVRQPGGR